ncbi:MULTISPECIES: DUF3558 domain-containing protein [Actinokineospora]|nr:MULTISPECIES: DUF3558 domain-containing protein [Actinokineospora]UVS82594.1 hypothetical protein Actkin_06368 [Actinokineospora sp. UTMC 2448]
MAAIVLLTVVAAGCSTNEPGTPAPGPGDGSSAAPPATTTSASRPGVDLPPRPQDLPIDGIAKPCDLFTDAQREQLRVDRARDTVSRGEVYEGQQRCALTLEGGDPYLDVSVLLVTSEGAEAWLAGDRNVTAEQTSIEGFGAAHYWLAGGEGAECNTAVDVADGQHLQVGLLMPGEGWAQEKLCETTDQVAAAALKTLQAG